jgi:transcriptional regulator GlxA family with amidase domain
VRHRIGLVLLPGFRLLELAGAVDALGAANQLLDGVLYDPRLYSVDGAAVPTAQGVRVEVDGPLAEAEAGFALGVVAAQMPRAGTADALAVNAALRLAASRGSTLLGIGSGAGWLAHAGLLDGYRCATRWEQVTELALACPNAIVSEHLYECDRQRLTCAGGSASTDLTVHWLGQRHGGRLAQQLTSALGLDRLRPGDERQRHARTGALSSSSKLGEALALMQANLGEPLATDDIAGLVGVSRRQLERLFKQHLNELPARWYLQLRLERARGLLQQSSQSVLQIGLGCGFASGPHFSRAYRTHFGLTPREERAGRAAAWRDAPAADPAYPAALPGDTLDPT